MIPNLSAKSTSHAGKRRFRPHPVLTVVAIILILLTARLSVWQFDRAEQKAALEDAARNAMQSSPVNLNAYLQSQEAVLHPYRRVAASGVYMADKQIAIDNKVHQRIAGYHIITPLSLSSLAKSEISQEAKLSDKVIAVNRGFVARRESIPPPPLGTVTLFGILQKDQADAYTLSPDTEAGAIWQNLDLQKYKQTLNLPLFSLVLLQMSVTTTSTLTLLPPASVRVDFKSAQSIGYAWQWLTFCALAIIFYIILGYRDRERTES